MPFPMMSSSSIHQTMIGFHKMPQGKRLGPIWLLCFQSPPVWSVLVLCTIPLPYIWRCFLCVASISPPRNPPPKSPPSGGENWQPPISLHLWNLPRPNNHLNVYSVTKFQEIWFRVYKVDHSHQAHLSWITPFPLQRRLWTTFRWMPITYFQPDPQFTSPSYRVMVIHPLAKDVGIPPWTLILPGSPQVHQDSTRRYWAVPKCRISELGRAICCPRWLVLINSIPTVSAMSTQVFAPLLPWCSRTILCAPGLHQCLTSFFQILVNHWTQQLEHHFRWRAQCWSNHVGHYPATIFNPALQPLSLLSFPEVVGQLPVQRNSRGLAFVRGGETASGLGGTARSNIRWAHFILEALSKTPKGHPVHRYHHMGP